MSLWDIDAHLMEDDFDLEFCDVSVKSSLFFDDAIENVREIKFSNMPNPERIEQVVAQRYYDAGDMTGFAKRVSLTIPRTATEDEVQYLRARNVYDEAEWN